MTVCVFLSSIFMSEGAVSVPWSIGMITCSLSGASSVRNNGQLWIDSNSVERLFPILITV